MSTRTAYAAACLALLSLPAAAQTPISEADALVRLSPESPRVRALRASTDILRADVEAAGRWPNPRATFNRESVAGVTEYMVTVTQPLPISGRRGLEESAASVLVEASARRADDAIRRARAELRDAYADLVAAQVRESVLNDARERLRALAETLARREDAGESAGYDRLRAEREVADLESELASARGDRARAQAAVAAFFAPRGDIAAIVAVIPSPGDRPPVPGIDELIQRAEAARGDLLALGREAEAARLAAQAAGRSLVPDPEIMVGTKSSNVGDGDVGSVFGIHASIPLFDRAKPEKARAQARLAEAESRAAVLRAELAADIAGLRSLVIERRDAADRYRLSSASTTARLERIAQVSYDAGERGILELLDAYRGTVTARTRLAALDAAARHAEIELEFVSGWEMP